MKRTSLDNLLSTRKHLSYQEQYEYIRKLLEEGRIKPVKASKTNGKKPALYREYWILEEAKDYSSYIEEIKYTFSTMIWKNARKMNCASARTRSLQRTDRRSFWKRKCLWNTV